MSSSEKYDYLTMDNVTNIVIKSCPNNVHNANLHVWFYFFYTIQSKKNHLYLSFLVRMGGLSLGKTYGDSTATPILLSRQPPVSICLRTTSVQYIVELILDSQCFRSISK